MPLDTMDHREPVRPLVNDALNALSTAEAAQRRGSRTLEKLAGRLHRRGVVVPVDPPAAAEWALSLRNEPTRTNVLQDALGAWRQTDPRAATAWALEKGVKPNPP